MDLAREDVIQLVLAIAVGGLIGAVREFRDKSAGFRPLIFMITKERFTIPLGLFDLQGYMMTGSISVVLAGIVLSIIPVLIVYAIGQRYLVEGIMMGGLKS